MAFYDRVLSGVHRYGQGFVPGPVRAEDRGPDDDLDSLFPVEELSLDGATEWLNSPPLSGEDLRGRVVLVHFWTSSSIHAIRSLPQVRAWARAGAGHGLVVIGVHSPEFSFERDVDTVRHAAAARSLGHAIAVDNAFEVWRSFRNEFWPAFFVIDASGRLRHHSFGESGYDETRAVLRRLITDSGAGDPGPLDAPVDARGVEGPADWHELRTAETHLGYRRSARFASPGGLVPDEPSTYVVPPHQRLGEWALTGRWTIGSESAQAHLSGGRLTCRFHARDVHLVAAPAADGASVRCRVTVDGRAPGEDVGEDVDATGHATIGAPRLHHLLRRSGPIDDSTVEVEFLDPGVRVHALSFG